MLETRSRIRLLSRTVRALCVLGTLCLIGVSTYLWTSSQWLQAVAAGPWGLGAFAVQLNLHNRLLGAAASSLSLAASLYMLWQIWSLFGAYERGQVLTKAAVLRMRGVAIGMLALALAQPLSMTLIGLALTMDNPAGHRALVVGLSWNDYLTLLFGLVMLAIASVMAEAVAIADENAGFV